MYVCSIEKLPCHKKFGCKKENSTEGHKTINIPNITYLYILRELIIYQFNNRTSTFCNLLFLYKLHFNFATSTNNLIKATTHPSIHESITKFFTYYGF